MKKKKTTDSTFEKLLKVVRFQYTAKKNPSKRTEILHCHRHESNWMITLKKCVESKVLPKEDKMLSHNKKNLRFFFHFHTGIINNSPVVSI